MIPEHSSEYVKFELYISSKAHNSWCLLACLFICCTNYIGSLIISLPKIVQHIVCKEV